MSDPWLGRRLADRFDVLARLGSGATGTVYRARDLVAEREVALKILFDHRLDERQRARFRREGEVTASLDHPGIVRVHSSGELPGGVPWLAYELIDGARTFDKACAEPGVDHARRVAWVRDAARALGVAHAREIVHRDVKHDNLLVDATHRLRVADFGMAWATNAERLTRTGAVVGTPYFMAPEQLAPDGRPAHPTFDVWALGVTLYSALLAEFPFDAPSIDALTIKVCGADPVPPSRRDPTISPAVEAVCLRCLEKEPDARYPHGEALAADLDRALAGQVVQARRRRLSRGQRRTLVLAVAPALAVGGLVVASLVPTSGGDPPAPKTARPRPPRAPEAPKTPIVAPLASSTTAATTEPRTTPPPRLSPEAREVWELARAGHPGPMRAIAMQLRDGTNGYPLDVAEAVRWYVKGAALGDPDCMCHLARLFLDGRGADLPADPLRGAAYFEQAVELGDARAMRELAFAYQDGRGGLARDWAKAAALYERHAREVPDGGETLLPAAILLMQGGPNLSPDPARALPHLEVLVGRGDAEGMYWMALVLRERRVPKEEARAVELLERALELGFEAAVIPLAQMLFTGWGVATDPARARALLERAVAEGLAGAQEALDSLGPP